MIGGKEGWFNSNWMWKLRGMVDGMLLGVGSSRGRRSRSSLRINDVIDFWRVEDMIKDTMLLRAEMKLPGKAWLQFTIDTQKEPTIVSVKAFYQTSTIRRKTLLVRISSFPSFHFPRFDPPNRKTQLKI